MLDRRKREGFVFLFLFMACIPMANWMIQNVGTTCIPEGPCLIPIAPNIHVPSGVLIIGLAFVFRDLVQRRLGIAWVLGAIACGTALSAAIAPPSLVWASAVAFLISELADLTVYTPLQKRRLLVAVFASGLVGAVLDSAIFLYMAFGNLDYLLGQVLGKMAMVTLALPFVNWLRTYDARFDLTPV